MLEEKKLTSWNDQYWNQIKRNIGLISIAEQERIKKARIAIFGVGGLGGPVLEQLVRSGCEYINICDNDKFIGSNLNRQLCYNEDIGTFKIDFFHKITKKINPNINIEKYYRIDKENIASILKDVNIAVLCLDDPLASIIITRACLKHKIPLLESWGIPYLCAWYFTSDSVDYESCYKLDTKRLSIDEIKKSTVLQKNIKNKILSRLTQFPGIKERFDRESGVLEGLLSGQLSSISFAPIVRLSASYLAFEVIFSGILKIKKMVKAPKVIGYDYLEMKSFEFDFI